MYTGSMSVEDQRDERKRTTEQVSKIKNDLNTGGYLYVRISSGETSLLRLGGIRDKGGVTFIQAPVGNTGTSCPDIKGEIQVEDP